MVQPSTEYRKIPNKDFHRTRKNQQEKRRKFWATSHSFRAFIDNHRHLQNDIALLISWRSCPNERFIAD